VLFVVSGIIKQSVLPPHSKTTDNIMNKKMTPADLFLGILALLLISVSFYQTWLGCSRFLARHLLSLPWFIIPPLFLCWMLRNAKLEGKPTGSLVGIYIFIASFCFIANFNALYTRFMKTDIYTDELRDINKNFTALENDVESKLKLKYNKVTTQNIEIKKKQMMEQIKDPGNKGIGTRAQLLIKDIERLTGQGRSADSVGNDYEDLAERMENRLII
jgi:hypothetical protein